MTTRRTPPWVRHVSALVLIVHAASIARPVYAQAVQEDLGPAEPEAALDAVEALGAPPAAATDETPQSGMANAKDRTAPANGSPAPPSFASGAAAFASAGAGAPVEVSTTAIHLPKGQGSVEGLGESFSPQLSSGVLTFRIPFRLPPIRGGAAPQLALSYSSGGGSGNAGFGWDVGVVSIARQTDRGTPSYADAADGSFSPAQDRFVLDGGTELVPLGVVRGGACAAAPGETMPAWAEGWQYFRPRVEGAFLRAFWSVDHRTWRLQSKSGVTMELGAPLRDRTRNDALEVDPANTSRIFRWQLARAFDSQGDQGPNNEVVYRYRNEGGVAYLEDIYGTPARTGDASSLSAYAVHVHLSYEERPDARASLRSGWEMQHRLRLARVDITSKEGDVAAPRRLVRRYHLGYDAASFSSLLTSVQVEGRCATAVTEGATGSLPETTGCPRLPAMTLAYTSVSAVEGAASFGRHGTLGGKVRTLANPPSPVINGTETDFVDVNGDGLADVLRTVGSTTSHRVFFAGAGGVADSFGNTTLLTVASNARVSAGELQLGSPAVGFLDLDGDGRIEGIYMPPSGFGEALVPALVGSAWTWMPRPLRTPRGPDGVLNVTGVRKDLRVADVNGDGLVDLVLTTGSRIQTYFALGRYPGGDGKFGSAAWTGPSTATLSEAPVERCLPGRDGSIQFSDPSVKLGDLNGDGLIDIAVLRSGSLEYFPGRGDGTWGRVTAAVCTGALLEGAGVAMQKVPSVSKATRLLDLNGDGLEDVVNVLGGGVYAALNEGGLRFTDEQVIKPRGLPSAGAEHVRFVDVDGTGTPELVWSTGTAYVAMDPLNGTRPRLLQQVANGLGRTLDFEYVGSGALMLEAERAGKPWASKMPLATTVLRRSTESDNLGVAGRAPNRYVTEYTYRDPLYDGRQREFRGFAEASARKVGDADAPSSTVRSRFLLGECADETADDVADCEPAGRWRDNAREALKGLPVFEETFDDANRVLSVVRHGYRLRQLYAGLDGRRVRHAFEEATETYLYDAAVPAPSASPVSVTDVVVEDGPTTSSLRSTLPLRVGAGRVKLRQERTVDRFGNELSSTDSGCVEGCASMDESITRGAEPVLVGNGSGWLWRTRRTWIQGSATGRRKQSSSTYDTRGNVTATRAILTGTLPLDRFHASGGSVAPAPASASTDGEILLSATDYDELGNAVFSRAPGNQCRRVAYDAAYGVWPETETAFVGARGADQGGQGSGASALFASTRDGAACGAVALTARASYDRGLGVVTDVVGLHGERTRVDYDGFGRLARLWKPHPYTRGALSPKPSVVVEYQLPEDWKTQPVSRMRTQVQDGLTVDDASYRETWAYVDGLGRTVLSLEQADPTAGDGGAWIASGMTQYNAKGAVQRAFQPWFVNGNASAFPLSEAPKATFARHVYDAFGRVTDTYGLDGMLRSRVVHHALSTDAYDKAQLLSDARRGLFSTSVRDGHGRTVSTVERRRVSGVLEALETRTEYLASGEPLRITRAVQGSGTPVVRWMRYDSLGRRVLNVEPNTAKNFTADASADPSTLKAWRYAYDDGGRLVGTSDARGCGINYHFDAGGRPVAEDYSPCTSAQPAYSAPNLASGDGTEVFYRYDTVDPTAVAPGCAQDPALLLGRVSSIASRGDRVLYRPDGRGRMACFARAIAKPLEPGDDEPTVRERYAPEWLATQTTYDAADRPVLETTGATTNLSPEGDSYVRTVYTKRATVRAVCSSYGQARARTSADDVCGRPTERALVSAVVRAANGRIERIAYGDLAATTSSFAFDVLERLTDVRTERGRPSLWSAPGYPASRPGEPTQQAVLEDGHFEYDEVDNPTRIEDRRDAALWPAGAKPVRRDFGYDDLYRLVTSKYAYASGDDAWTSPFDAEVKEGTAPPHVSFAKRVKEQTYAFDAFGNITSSSDDAGGFYDRSLGAQVHGTPSDGPYQLRSATNGVASPANPRAGRLSAEYDDAGNLERLVVTRDGPCLPIGARCQQAFAYTWDEAGRLARARRSDGAAATTPDRPVPSADLRYAYDATGMRVLKTAAAAAGEATHTVYALGAVELRRARFKDGAYEHTAKTEVPFLFGHGVRLARVHTSEEDLPRATSGSTHVLMVLPDHLGSSSIVLDQGTSELVERSTYQAYGAAESDYRPERWGSFREDYRFTGKEEDVDVGLQYFGFRYYAAALGRWVSPDPLAVHELGADPNVYAYVHGRVLQAVDPVGLDATTLTSDQPRLQSVDFHAESQQAHQQSLTEANPEAASLSQAFEAYVPKAPPRDATDFFGHALDATAAAGEVAAKSPTLGGAIVGRFAQAATAGVAVPTSMILQPLHGLQLGWKAGEAGKQGNFGRATWLVAVAALELSAGRAGFGKAAAGGGPLRVTQFYDPARGPFGPGAARAIESKAPTSAIAQFFDGANTSGSWVAPGPAAQMGWFSRTMTGRWNYTHYVEFTVTPTELANPGGLKTFFRPWQQVIPGGVDLAGRSATFGQLGPNYGAYIFFGALGAAAAGTAYNAVGLLRQ